MNAQRRLRKEIAELLKNLGALKVGFASATTGWKMTINGCRPTDIMPNCNSVIVLAVRTGLNYYQTANFENKSVDVDHKTYRICFLFAEWLTLKLSRFLEDRGYKTAIPSEWVGKEKWRDAKNKIHRFSLKLAAYEAGIGVFGRCGLIVTPELGPRIRLGALLTDAELDPTPKLEDFNPCRQCTRCAEICPVEAIDPTLPPPKGFNREKCVNFVYFLRKSTRNKIFYCGVCFENCPVANEAREGFRLQKLGSLRQIRKEVREKLLLTWANRRLSLND
jgi:epoxyqueuosine reductase QueG